MTSQEMPKRIFVDPDYIFVEDMGRFYTGSNSKMWFENKAEYVRADLVTGDASEPLEEGQYRWFMASYEDVWRVGLVRTAVVDEWECFAFEIEPGDWVEDFRTSKIGPAIRPPEDV